MIKTSKEQMSKEIIPEIKANYSFYNKILKERKSIFEEVISIKEVGNNNNILEESVAILHQDCSSSIHLIASVKTSDLNFFQFKLRCKDICLKPFFRYDSDGDTHRNYIDDLPIEEQQVTTPHFHYYNHDGLNIAYKTQALLDEEQQKALEDISMCIAHFFQEANIVTEYENICEVQILPNLLPLKQSKNDPHANIIFQ